MASVSIESPNFQTRPRTTRFKSKPIEHLSRIHDLARHRCRRYRERPGEVDLRVHAAFAALEVARGRGDADLAVGEKSHPRLAHAAPGRNHLRAGFDELLDESCL